MNYNITASIKSGFRACGIRPLDRQEVLKNLPLDPVEAAVAGASVDVSVLEHLKKRRGPEPEGTALSQKRKRLQVGAGRASAANHPLVIRTNATHPFKMNHHLKMLSRMQKQMRMLTCTGPYACCESYGKG